ncbi:hypothetical protein C8J57DRAFT_1226255 [Mycena rebaudengoi]|nr:hypothetical protein C8J57DRAFT_1226255 [Mycena rebaudengoi]
MAARELALQAPLQTGTPALEIPLPNLAPNARKLPRVPSSDPAVVQLHDKLQRGIDGFSQVWTAGLLIPYFFGLSTIVIPCAEEAWVLVWNSSRPNCQRCYRFRVHIKYPRLRAPLLTRSNSEQTSALWVDPVREFVRVGWTLRDIRPPNFILTNAPGAWAMVIIDLFLSKPIKSTADRELIASSQVRSFFSNSSFACITLTTTYTTGEELAPISSGQCWLPPILARKSRRSIRRVLGRIWRNRGGQISHVEYLFFG